MIKVFDSGKSRRKGILAISVISLVVVLFWLMNDPLTALLMDTPRLAPFIEELGVFGPLVFILINIIQVVVAPVPGQLAGLVSGYFFGPWLGTLYTLIGTVIGSLIAFWLARKYGRPFVESVIRKPLLEKFDHFSEEKGVLALFLIFLLPVFPDDAICFIAGLTAIPLRRLVLIAAIGRLPGFFVLNLLGAGFEIIPRAQWIALAGAIVLVSVIMYIYRRQIENWMHRKVKNLKKRLKRA